MRHICDLCSITIGFVCPSLKLGLFRLIIWADHLLSCNLSLESNCLSLNIRLNMLHLDGAHVTRSVYVPITYLQLIIDEGFVFELDCHVRGLSSHWH